MDSFHTLAPFRIRNADEETTTLSTSRQFLAVIKRSRSRRKKEGGISSKQIARYALCALRADLRFSANVCG